MFATNKLQPRKIEVLVGEFLAAKSLWLEHCNRVATRLSSSGCFAFRTFARPIETVVHLVQPAAPRLVTLFLKTTLAIRAVEYISSGTAQLANCWKGRARFEIFDGFS
jgi:hypothetical protein